MNELLPVVYFLGEPKALLIPGAPGERSTKVTPQTPDPNKSGKPFHLPKWNLSLESSGIGWILCKLLFETPNTHVYVWHLYTHVRYIDP